jgi:hypothetical protein
MTIASRRRRFTDIGVERIPQSGLKLFDNFLNEPGFSEIDARALRFGE